jgi:glycosyltransferase involved in cell wall biosynthesis
MFIDVTELLLSLSNGFVTGLQRVQIELLTALCDGTRGGPPPQLFWLNTTTARLDQIEYSTVRQRLNAHLRPTSQEGLPVRRPTTERVAREAQRIWRWRLHSPMVRRLVGAAHGATAPLPDWLTPGSTVFLIGGTWGVAGHAELIARAREERHLFVVALIYDLIPIRRPELWAGREHSKSFAAWFDRMMDLADLVLTISDFTKREVLDLLKGRPARRVIPVHRIPLGHGFTILMNSGVQANDRDDLAPPEEFVLCVSTIEGRKNHGLLLRTWRSLIEELGHDATPRLVLIGRRAWLSNDFFTQLDACDHLGGKIQVVYNCSDQQLKRLYERCLFSIYPSLYEGWGLPVAEALLAGASCLCSNRTSIPEVAGDAVEYFDPEDGPQALALVRSAIVDPRHRERLRDKARTFRARSWAETAKECLTVIAASRNAVRFPAAKEAAADGSGRASTPFIEPAASTVTVRPNIRS